MKNKKKQKQQLVDTLKTGEKLETMLKKAKHTKRAARASKKEEPKPHAHLSRMALNYLLFFVFVGVTITTFLVSFKPIAFFRDNLSAEITFKIVLAVVYFVGYLKGRQMLTEMLFPNSEKQLVRTVYKYNPEIDFSQTNERLILRWEHNKMADFLLLAAVVVILGLIILANPELVPFSFGLLDSSGPGGIIFKVILVCLVVGVYLSIRNLLITHKEYLYMQEMIWKVRNTKFDYKKGLHFQKLLPSNEHSLVAQKMKMMMHILKLEGHIDHDALHSKSFVRHSLKDGIPRYLAAAMPILGLIGTLLGLSMAISGLESVLQTGADNVDMLREGLTESLQGIGTAFYTTLEGAICMLILKYFTLATSNKRIVFLTDLEEAIMVEVLPRLQKRHKYIKIID